VCNTYTYTHVPLQIPESMGELRALVALDVSRNQLTGTIPSTFEVKIERERLQVASIILS
jgi:hypothetical protein